MRSLNKSSVKYNLFLRYLRFPPSKDETGAEFPVLWQCSSVMLNQSTNELEEAWTWHACDPPADMDTSS